MLSTGASAAAVSHKWRVSDVSEFAINANVINVDFNVQNDNDFSAQPLCVIDVYVGKSFAGAASLMNLSTAKPGGIDISINNRVPVSRHRAHQVKKSGVQVSCASASG